MREKEEDNEEDKRGNRGPVGRDCRPLFDLTRCAPQVNNGNRGPEAAIAGRCST